MKRRMFFVLSLSAAIGIAHAATKSEPEVTVAQAGTVTIAQQELTSFISALSAQQRQQWAEHPERLESWLRARLAEKLLLREAAAQQWQQRPEVKALLEQTQQQVILRSYLNSVSQVPSDYPSEAELKAAYNQVKSRLMTPARYRLAQIFIPAPLNDDKAQQQVQDRVAQIAHEAQRHPDDFARLIKKYPAPNSSSIADTGWVSAEQLVPEVRPVVARLDKGAVSAPVQSTAGFHIIRLVDVQPAVPLSFNDAESELRERLKTQRQQQIAQAYLAGLANDDSITINNQALQTLLDQPATAQHETSHAP